MKDADVRLLLSQLKALRDRVRRLEEIERERKYAALNRQLKNGR